MIYFATNEVYRYNGLEGVLFNQNPIVSLLFNQNPINFFHRGGEAS
jgi:hypothetical protein